MASYREIRTLALAAPPSCKIPHDTDGYLPAWLCRQCHPELTATPEERKAAQAADRKLLAQHQRHHKRQLEIASLERQIFALGNPREGSVSYRIKMSHQKKLAKLRRQAA